MTTTFERIRRGLELMAPYTNERVLVFSLIGYLSVRRSAEEGSFPDMPADVVSALQALGWVRETYYGWSIPLDPADIVNHHG